MWTQLLKRAKQKMNNSAQTAKKQEQFAKNLQKHNQTVTAPTTQGTLK